VDGVAEQLASEGYQVDRLHGDISQAQRERVMRRFRERKIEFLIATDVAARGIDVDDVEVVLNYDLPRDPEDYVHRIGRTGRAGRSGLAISFTTPREVYMLERIARLTRIRVRREKLPTAAEAALRRTEALVNRAKLLLAEGSFPANKAATQSLLGDGTSPEQVVAALLHLLLPKKSTNTSEQTGDGDGESRHSEGKGRSRQSARGGRERWEPEGYPAQNSRKRTAPEPVSRRIRDPLPPTVDTHVKQHRKTSFNKSRPWSAKSTQASAPPKRAPRRSTTRP
jgi:ATP-dependent RNA helicase DeaD